MFWYLATFAYSNRCRAGSLCSVTVYAYCHIYDILINHRPWLPLRCTSPYHMFNFLFQNFNVFIIWNSCRTHLLLLKLSMVVEHIKLPHRVNTFQMEFRRYWAWRYHSVIWHWPTNLSREALRLWSWWESFIIKECQYPFLAHQHFNDLLTLLSG